MNKCIGRAARWTLFSLVAVLGLPGGVFSMDLVGVKPTALAGAYRALADDNNALYYNPAGIAQQKNYIVDMIYHNDVPSRDWYAMSATDTVTSPVGAGLFYQYRRTRQNYGDYTEHLAILALTQAYGNQFYFGVSGKYLGSVQEIKTVVDDEEVTEKEKNDFFTTDVGLLWRPSTYISMAAVGHNLVKTDDKWLPRQAALGLALQYMSISLAGDAVAQENDGMAYEEDLDYHAGLQFLLYEQVYLCGGYAWEENPKLEYLGAGIIWKAPRVSMGGGMMRDTMGLGLEQYVFSIAVGFK